MHTGTVDLRLPSLREDPFSQGPLSAKDSNLLVGRHSYFEEMEKNIQFKSSRRILLVGEYGSGKTSFVNCLGGKTNLHIHVDRIDTVNPGLELLRDIYSQVVNVTAPSDHKKLERELAASLHSKRNYLPLISVDADMADIASLEACLLASVPFFERLAALIIVAVNPNQKSLLSEQIRERFEVRPMEELDADSVKALVERRIGTCSNEPYQMTTEEAGKVLGASRNGHPGSIIKVLRSVIDGQMLPELPQSPVSENMVIEDIPSPVPQEIDTGISNQEHELLDGLESKEASEQKEEEVAQDIDEWKDGPGMSGTMGFDLNLEELEEPTVEEMKEKPIEDTYVTEDDFKPVGIFGGLRGRWKQTSQSIDEIQEPEGEYQQLDGANSLWVSKNSLPIQDEEVEDIPPAENALEPESLIVETFEADYQEMIQENTHQPNDLILKTLTDLLSKLLTPSGDTMVSNKLAESLQTLSRPKIGGKEEHPLNVQVLTSLTKAETIVVSIAQQRSVSPSDKQLLEKLNIKRARLSQICNRLHKAGILDVRMVGRSRMFGLTRTALAQMMAWGLVGGDV
ncbi:MAG: helix-turn-helix domain-containing protein [Candidatus Poseidoniaceae archaeon]|nr:helix-turn-helix domain-containing protein [Candidatus Poseidoniaceae archaeon]